MQSIALFSLTPDELRSIIADAVRETIAGAALSAPTPTPEAAELLTRDETAHELHVSKVTLRSFELRGILKPHRIGRRVLYSRHDIQAALGAGQSSADGHSIVGAARPGRRANDRRPIARTGCGTDGMRP